MTVCGKRVNGVFEVGLSNQQIVRVMGRNWKDRDTRIGKRFSQRSHNARQGPIQRPFTFQDTPTGNT